MRNGPRIGARSIENAVAQGAIALVESGLDCRRDDRALQFDRSHLRTVLLTLKPTLRLLVVVKLALNPVGGAVEEVDLTPEQVFKVGLEAGVLEYEGQGIEDVRQAAGDVLAFGERPRVGLVLKGTIAVELEFVENGGGRALILRLVVVGRHGRLRYWGRASRGLSWATESGGGSGLHRRVLAAAEAQRRTAEARYFGTRGGRRPGKIVRLRRCRTGRAPV